MVRYQQYRDLEVSTILDFSPVEDLDFADVNLRGKEFELFESIYDHTSGSCPLPDFAVLPDLETDHLLDRIEHRGREYEKGLDPAYLEAVRGT